MSYGHLQTPKNVTSGVTALLLWAPVADFDVAGIKDPVGPFVNLGDKITIAGPHVFLANKGFYEIIAAPWKNKLNLDSIGEPGSIKFNNKAEYVVTGSYKEIHEMVAEMMNKPGIVLIHDADDPTLVYQIGSSTSHAYFTATPFETGTEKDGQKSYKLTIECPAKSALIYTGAITKHP